MPTTYTVKNMVCHRCLLALEDILKRTAVPYRSLQVGEIHVDEEWNEASFNLLQKELKAIGLELTDSRLGSLIEKIKNLVIARARKEAGEEPEKQKLSAYLSSALHHEYTYLSSLFSAIEGRTIEQYFIEQRIEKAKELLVYNEMTLSQIAFDLDYSSTAYLSNQFKKITGLTPSHFKKLGAAKRRLLDKV